MNEYEDKDWGIEIARCDDGDILLRQGECGCGDDVTVRLHTCHFPLIAKHLELKTQAESDNATTRSNDRLNILVNLIVSHLPPEHPLVRAATILIGSNGQQRHEQKQDDILSINKQFSLIEE